MPAADAISILFVDDEPAVLRAIRRALTGCPWEIVTAHGPREALDLLGARPVDVLVSDVDMPEINGIELTRIARRDHPDTVRMLLTGAATLETALAAINQGEVARFFVKPFEARLFFEEMEVIAERVLKQRAARESHGSAVRRRELARWLDERFPGVLDLPRDEGGELVLDPIELIADLDAGRLPPAARDLLRKEG